MTGRQKRYWQILATFLLGGAVAGVAYNVVRVHLAPINFATGAIFGLMIARASAPLKLSSRKDLHASGCGRSRSRGP